MTDRYEHDDRRQHALHAAAAFHAGRTAIDPEHVVAAAIVFEQYLLTGELPPAAPEPSPMR